MFLFILFCFDISIAEVEEMTQLTIVSYILEEIHELFNSHFCLWDFLKIEHGKEWQDTNE